MSDVSMPTDRQKSDPSEEAGTPPVTGEDTDTAADPDARWHQQLAERQQRSQDLRNQARAVYRAMEGWDRVQSAEDWQDICAESAAAYESGEFLVQQLGAERHLEPRLMATLLALRRDLTPDPTASAAERMLADLTVVSYHHALHIQEIIGNFALILEAELFGQESLTLPLHWQAKGQQTTPFQVEAYARRLREELLPLFERANRLVIRNLQAMREVRRGPAPQVNIGAAGQVNVAQQQQNAAASPDPP